jgi:CHAT domain-containing protein/TPR repeat protein
MSKSELDSILEKLVQLHDSQDILQKIDLCRQALGLARKEDDPRRWAYLHFTLGTNLEQNLLGHRVENLEQAIFHLKQALEVCTREASPELWAGIQMDLGVSHTQRIRGDRAKNLEQAIQCHSQALEVFTRDKFPKEWAAIQDNLGGVYKDRVIGEKAENIEKAIEYFQKALEIRSKQELPEDWARTHNNLGVTYSDRIRGNRADNFEEAIKHLNLALEVRTRDALPKDWATTQNNLGTTYEDRIRGERAENIEQAIYHLQQALEVRTRENHPEGWARLYKNLGDVYNKRVRGNPAENIEQAIFHCEQALEVFTLQDFPEMYAGTQINLANAHQGRTQGNRVENIEQSIYHYTQALDIYTRQAYPEMWARTQNSLADTFCERVRGNPAENIEQALRCCQLALEVATQKDFPETWARINGSLGNAYLHRIEGDQADNFERAIFHCEQALEILTYQNFPIIWANIQHGLGLIYSQRIGGERADNIEKAIQYLLESLKVYTQESYPHSWANTHNSLAISFNLRIYGEKADNLEQCISNLQSSLQIFSRNNYPLSWAKSQNNLGLAYKTRILGNQAENLELSIFHCEQAFQVYTRENYPVEWAETHHNLASSLSDRILGDKDKNIDDAIIHSKLALEIITPYSDPGKCRNLGQSMGHYCIENKRWDIASVAFDVAIKADQIIFSSTLTSSSKRAELFETRSLYTSTAYALAQLGELEKAVEIVEAGRTRLLREFLERNREDLIHLPEMGFAELYDEYIQITKNISNLVLNIPANPYSQGWYDKLESAYKKRQDVVQRIQTIVGEKHPEFRYFLGDLPFEEIKLQAKEAPLVYLLTSVTGGMGLIVTSDGVDFILLDNITDESLYQKVSGAYWQSYFNHSYNEWMENLEQMTGWLWDSAIGELVKFLLNHNHKRVILIPTGLFGMLPLHGAWEKDQDDYHYAIDDITFTYTPSARAHMEARQKATSRHLDTLLVVDNPDGSLVYTNEETKSVLSHFANNTFLHLQGKQATTQRIRQAINEFDIIHFSTHGYANYHQPMSSGLLLANGEFLTLEEISQTRFERARLAVLSACETSVSSDIQLLDEVISLPAGFIIAGLPGVIGSLWSVNDLSTAILMAWFYQFWQVDKMVPQEALRRAQLLLRKMSKQDLVSFLSGRDANESFGRFPKEVTEALLGYVRSKKGNPEKPVFSNPFWWAGFIYVGV